MRISDWSSDLCSSDLRPADPDPTCSARAYRPRLLGRRRGLARRHLPAAALRLGLLPVHPDPIVLPRPDEADFSCAHSLVGALPAERARIDLRQADGDHENADRRVAELRALNPLLVR